MSRVEREGCVYSNYSKMPNLEQSLCSLSQEELQSGLVTGVLQTKKSHNQAEVENTNHFRKRPLLH